MTTIKPEIGLWLRDRDTGAIFEIVAIDRTGGMVDVQYLDGTLGEYEIEAWEELPLEAVAAPEDWRDAFELADEDSLDPDMPYHPEDWGGPLNTIEPEYMRGVEDF